MISQLDKRYGKNKFTGAKKREQKSLNFIILMSTAACKIIIFHKKGIFIFDLFVLVQMVDI